MARGWESKAVEAQIEEEERASETERRPASTGSSEQRMKLESLRLSRARVEQQLERAVLPAHREMLMKALRSLENEADEINRKILQDES